MKIAARVVTSLASPCAQHRKHHEQRELWIDRVIVFRRGMECLTTVRVLASSSSSANCLALRDMGEVVRGTLLRDADEVRPGYPAFLSTLMNYSWRYTLSILTWPNEVWDY